MSYFDDTTRNAAMDAVKALGDRISLHTGDPGSTGTNELAGGTYARVQTTWGASTAGIVTGTAQTVNVPAGSTIHSFGVWTSGGTFRIGGRLRNAAGTAITETFTTAGTHTITPKLTGTASAD